MVSWVRTWPPRLPLGFAARLGLANSLLFVLICTGQSWVVAGYYFDDIRTGLTDRGHAITEYVATRARRSMLGGRVDELREIAAQARLQRDVVYARFFDAHGLLLVSEGTPPSGSPTVQMPGAPKSAGPIPLGRDFWQFEAPIFPPPGTGTRDRASSADAPASAGVGQRPSVLGTVAIGMSLDSLQSLRQRTLSTTVPFTALFTLSAVVSAMLLARASTRSLDALATAADRVARGDFTAKVTVRARDEIGHLARSFNAMVQNLAQSAVLEKEVRDLQELTRLKSQFLATISHELRTPLNVILGYSEMLAAGAGGTVTAEQSAMVAAIRRYSKLQLDLITNVLDFSRLASGQISYRVERFALGPLFAEIQALHGAEPKSRNVALTFAVDPAVPELETDRIKLHEIVRNLVDNAIKFTELGFVSMTARPAANPESVIIEVTDTGPGLTAEDALTIFEPFRQLSRDSGADGGGVGLGLSIVKQLVEALGGTVSAEGRIGQGSSFRVEIPTVLPQKDGADGGLAASGAALEEATRNATSVAERMEPADGAGAPSTGATADSDSELAAVAAPGVRAGVGS